MLGPHGTTLPDATYSAKSVSNARTVVHAVKMHGLAVHSVQKRKHSAVQVFI